MSLIQVSNLTFCHEGSYDNIFEDLSLTLDSDWRLGLIGRNGRGKTTFLRLLGGLLPDGGAITASVAFDYFPYDLPDPGQNTLGLLRRLAPGAEDWRIARELSLLRVGEEALERPFPSLSNGEQTKVLLAVLFLRDNRFLLIDEPTNHLDMAARATVGEYLRGKRGFILVSHDRALLDGCIDHVLSLNKTTLELQSGNYSSWAANRKASEHEEQTRQQRLQKEVRHLAEAQKRTAAWSNDVERSKYDTLNSGLKVDRGFVGHRSAKMMKRAKAAEARRQKALDEASSLLRDVEEAETLTIHPLTHHAPRLVEAAGLSLFYGDKEVCRDVDLVLHPGERVALCGRNGSGKSSILRLLAGAGIRHTGQLRLASGLTLSVVPQDASLLRGNLREYAREQDIDESLFKAILRKLDFSRLQFEKDMADYSSGQKKKVLIARSLCARAHLYLWDEPLNFIDLLSRVQIEELLLRHAPTMLLVEHDRAFVDAVATRTIEL